LVSYKELYESTRTLKRSIDINALSTEQAEILSEQIGAKCREIIDEAANKVNAILNIYGMSAKIACASIS